MMSFQSRTRAPRARHAQRSQAEAADEQPQAPVGAPPARKGAEPRPGWSSSSLELLDGLEVTEQVPLDELPPEWADRLSRR